MASIFTYDPDPPRVSSPWSSSPHLGALPHRSKENIDFRGGKGHELAAEDLDVENLDDFPTTRLEAEPQEGPTEYKLHLLLRPRRSFSSTSTAKNIISPQQPRSLPMTPRSVSEGTVGSCVNPASSSSSRQHRLEQLTTQLLWRLQQSSPFHSSSTNNVILPTLPEATPELHPPQKPAKLLPGLEESKGALYEIGVSDDGTLVGLTRDEMNESLNNLQAMAASLGCSMDVLRMVPIGVGEWFEDVAGTSPDNEERVPRRGKLYVAEAYIKPELSNEDVQGGTAVDEKGNHTSNSKAAYSKSSQDPSVYVAREQLRVSLTGATTSGKSSLLGTLSTSTLDNSRGKSRLSLLKHRHEIASGMTSSVVQELIGYRTPSAPMAGDVLSVVNYAAPNVTTWNDIHVASETGRLAFVSDSAGHPRYRRTTVRGLVGWAPHWTMLCIAANDGSDPAGEIAASALGPNSGDFAGANAHLSMAHLDMCLRLQQPLVIVITKLDVASKTSFRQILSTLLSTLKYAGRKPVMLANDTSIVNEADLQRIAESDVADVKRFISTMGQDMHITVPIVLTSAVNGTGIGKIHALLRYLPLPSSREKTSDTNASQARSGQDGPRVLYHVDDVFDMKMSKTPGSEDLASSGLIVSGHLARGVVTVGDHLMLGPFSQTTAAPLDDNSDIPPSQPEDPFLTPRSFNDALARARSPTQRRVIAADREWCRVKVVSARNLRLPVHTLAEDRVGTLGIVSTELDGDDGRLMVRKGMVLTNAPLDAAHTLTASFAVDDASAFVVGSRVVIYSASVRSTAKIVAVSLESELETPHSQKVMPKSSADEDFTFGLEEDEEKEVDTPGEPDSILVTLQLVQHREWLDVGGSILIMPGGGPGLRAGDRGTKGLAGLEGFVGRIVETFD